MSSAPVAFTLPVALLLLVIAVASLLTARRGWSGRLNRASRWGLHSPAASAGDEAFRVANRVAAPVIGGAAAIAAVLTVLVPVLPLPTAATVVVGVLGLAAVLLLLVVGGTLGEQAARAVPVPARRPQPSGACAGCACGGGGCSGLTRTTAPGTTPPVGSTGDTVPVQQAGAEG